MNFQQCHVMLISHEHGIQKTILVGLLFLNHNR